MEGYTYIFYATLVAAAVFLTASSAPTTGGVDSLTVSRLKRSTETDLLGKVYLGLDIFQKVSVSLWFFYHIKCTSMYCLIILPINN